MRSLALGLGIAALLTSGAALAPVAAVAATPAVRIDLTSVSPAAVTPSDELTVAGRLVNTGTIALTDVRVQLRLGEDRLTSADDVSSWSQDVTGAGSGRVLPGTAVLAGAQAPGTTRPFTIRVPADDLDLPDGASSFGPRGLSVEVVTAGRTALATHRTSFVWYPGREFTPTSVSLLVPVTSAPRRDVEAVDAASVDALGTDGQLGRLLSAISDPGVAWALDPGVLAGAGAAAEGGGASPAATPAPSSSATASPAPAGTPPVGQAEGRAFLARVRAGLAGREVFSLPLADPDVAALAHRRAEGTLQRADTLAAGVERRMLGRALDTTTAWPAEGLADAATLATLARTGDRSVVLSSDAVPPVEAIGHTLTGRATVAAGTGKLPALLYDESLSVQFARTGSASGADGTQQLLSELAAVTLERPGDGRHLLITAPRGWNPEPGGVAAALAALRAVPWVDVQPLSALRATAVPETVRSAPLYPAAAAARELPSGPVGDALGLDRRAAVLAPAFASAGAAGGAHLQDLRMRALSLLSIAWRSGGMTVGVTDLQQKVVAVEDGVRIAQGSTVNLLASQAEVPVVVDNTLPYPVDLFLTLQPRSGQISVPKPIPVTLAAGANRVRVPVPVKAVASGDVEVEATLRTSAGDVVGSASVLDVRVRRGWEARGLGGFVVALLLVVAFGLIRGARRGRSTIPAEAVPDLDELVTENARRRAAHADVDTQQIPRPGPRPMARKSP